jgi:GNAT superfamily N-acetyltransferase
MLVERTRSPTPGSLGVASPGSPIELQPIGAENLADGSRILFEAFHELYEYHRFPGAYPSIEFAAEILYGLIEHPSIWGVAAHRDGLMIGSSFIDERGSIKGIGPVSVDPQAQARGVGRLLMQTLLDRAAGARGIRLLQDAFNRSSLALYVSLGFEVRESVALLAGRPRSGARPGIEVRPLEEGDIEECGRLCRAVHGHERTGELRDAVHDLLCAPVVALCDGRITAYATTLSYFPAAHGVAASDEDMQALILGGSALNETPVSLLVPTHQGDLLRWCLSERLRVIKPMSYLTIGEYHRPTGCWIPSLMY